MRKQETFDTVPGWHTNSHNQMEEILMNQGKRTSAIKKSKGFSAEEKAAMKSRAQSPRDEAREQGKSRRGKRRT